MFVQVIWLNVVYSISVALLHLLYAFDLSIKNTLNDIELASMIMWGMK